MLARLPPHSESGDELGNELTGDQLTDQCNHVSESLPVDGDGEEDDYEGKPRDEHAAAIQCVDGQLHQYLCIALYAPMDRTQHRATCQLVVWNASYSSFGPVFNTYSGHMHKHPTMIMHVELVISV